MNTRNTSARQTLLLNLFAIAATLTTATEVTLAQTADQASIRQVVERETDSWIKRDSKAMTDCWVNVPEASHLYSVPDGTVVFVTDLQKGVKEAVEGQKPTKDKFQNSGYKIRVNGNAAFIQFDQELTMENGTKLHSHQNRFLEKVNNDWKIVNATVVYYVPKKG